MPGIRHEFRTKSFYWLDVRVVSQLTRLIAPRIARNQEFVRHDASDFPASASSDEVLRSSS
jgi:hypothetical protein